MKFLFEFFPILLFFIVFKFKGIYYATGIAMAASVLQIIVTFLRKRRVEAPMWVSLAVLLVFGGFTLIFKNEAFIKWKPTVLYWVFASAIGIAKMAYNKNLIRALLQKQLQLPEQVWGRLNIGWAAFFAVLGILNLYIAFNFPTATWVNFKLFGLLGLTLVFAIIQSIFLAPHIQKQEN